MARIVVLVMAVAALGTLGCRGSNSAQPSGPPPDAIYFNGKIVTVDDDFSYAEAVAITGDKFTAVGTTDEVRQLAGPSTRQIDLRGLTVVPGLTDNHLHTAGGGPDIDLSGARSIDDVLQAITARIKESKPGDLILSNSDWHEAQLKEQRLPLRRDLDRVAPRNPVVLVRGGHEYILNSRALERWKITTRTQEPAGGRITKYEDGELNGELVDTAKGLVELPARPACSFEEQIQDQVAMYAKLHAAGLTAVRHPGGSADDYRVRKEIQRRGLLTMPVTQLIRLAGQSPAG